MHTTRYKLIYIYIYVYIYVNIYIYIYIYIYIIYLILSDHIKVMFTLYHIAFHANFQSYRQSNVNSCFLDGEYGFKNIQQTSNICLKDKRKHLSVKKIKKGYKS